MVASKHTAVATSIFLLYFSLWTLAHAQDDCSDAESSETSLFVTNLNKGAASGQPISSAEALRRLSAFSFLDQGLLGDLSSKSNGGRKSDNGPSGSNMCSIPVGQAGRLVKQGGGRKLLNCMPYFGCKHYKTTVALVEEPHVVATICVRTCCTSFEIPSANSKALVAAGRAVCPDWFSNLPASWIQIDPEPKEAPIKVDPEPKEAPIKVDPEPKEAPIKVDPEPKEAPIKVDPEPKEAPIKVDPEPKEAPIKVDPEPEEPPIKVDPEPEEPPIKVDLEPFDFGPFFPG